MVKRKVYSHGGSLVFAIPSNYANDMGIKPGTVLDVNMLGKGQFLTSVVSNRKQP